MTPTTKMAIVLLGLSLPLAGGGALLVRQAHAIPEPREPDHRAHAATIVDLQPVRCGRSNSPGTCYRLVAELTETTSTETTSTETTSPETTSGARTRVSTRSVYRPPPYERGDAVTVYVDAAGDRWLAFEWDARHAVRLREHKNTRTFPLVIGWLLLGCASFGVLLSAGLAFFVDRS